MRLEHFHMVDRIDAIDRSARTIRCTAIVPAQSLVFEGHFPGHPLLPATLMIETIAQSCGLLVLALTDFARMPLLVQVEKAKIRKTVAPAAILAVEGRLMQDGAAYAATAGKILCDGKTAAQAEIRLGLVPFPSEALRATVREHARALGLV